MTLRLAALHSVPRSRLEQLLVQQSEEWARVLSWDFQRIAMGVLFLAELGALSGVALLDEGDLAVAYALCADNANADGIDVKDFYVAPAVRGPEVCAGLLRGVFQFVFPQARSLRVQPSVPHAIEVEAGFPPCSSSFSQFAETRSLALPIESFVGPLARKAIELRPWAAEYRAEAVQLADLAFETGFAERPDGGGTAGAAGIVDDIVETQSAFRFLPECSFVALERATGRLCGLLLSSEAMPGTVYVSLLCTSPSGARFRLGHWLSEHCLFAIRAQGYRTVTMRRRGDHLRLERFYRRMGFVQQCELRGYLWEREPIRVTHS